jgi:hypothetical protein
LGCARRHRSAGCLLGAPVRFIESLTARTSTPIWAGLHRCVESDAGEGGGSVLPVVGFDRARGVASRSGKMLQESATGEVYRRSAGIAVRVGGGSGRGWADARRRGRGSVHGGAGGVARSIGPVVRWRGSSGSCRRSALQSRSCETRGGTSLVEELMDDVMARLASLSGRLYRRRSTQKYHRLRGDAAARLGTG